MIGGMSDGGCIYDDRAYVNDERAILFGDERAIYMPGQETLVIHVDEEQELAGDVDRLIETRCGIQRPIYRR